MIKNFINKIKNLFKNKTFIQKNDIDNVLENELIKELLYCGGVNNNPELKQLGIEFTDEDYKKLEKNKKDIYAIKQIHTKNVIPSNDKIKKEVEEFEKKRAKRKEELFKLTNYMCKHLNKAYPHMVKSAYKVIVENDNYKIQDIYDAIITAAINNLPKDMCVKISQKIKSSESNDYMVIYVKVAYTYNNFENKKSLLTYELEKEIILFDLRGN